MAPPSLFYFSYLMLAPAASYLPCQQLVLSLSLSLVETIGNTCYKGVPLSQIPISRKLGISSCITQRPQMMTVKTKGQLNIPVETVMLTRRVTRRVTRKLRAPMKQ